MKNALRNWKTTATGIAAIAGLVGPALVAPGSKVTNIIAVLSDPANLAVMSAAIGLIFAKDSDKSSTAQTDKK